MPINALPPDTIRSIGSTQVLTDSCSVVKELIDNSLDARASAISIEISINTLDIIQVKDNGHGIFPDDRSLVCKRYYTSKIRGLEDLEIIGGKFLGFRGEALASAAEMSGAMIVSTRIDGEATAVSLAVNRKGEVEKETRISHPVGTTIRIVDFLKHIPVRQQTALKASAKTTNKIRKLLYSYAYARPSVRFSLKVLRTNNNKGNWIYAPSSGNTVLEAAVKIGGKKLVEQCHWKVWMSNSEDPERISDVEVNKEAGFMNSYTIEALLPTKTYVSLAINNAGQYISIDSRPVSCFRGTLKQIINIYKSYLASGSLVEVTEGPKDPFICMNIICPPGSYDANVEPAKDDVLFANPSFLIGTLDSFFKSVYGELRDSSPAPQWSSNVKYRGFDVLLARKPPLNIATLPIQNGKATARNVETMYERVLNRANLVKRSSGEFLPSLHSRTGLTQNSAESGLERGSTSIVDSVSDVLTPAHEGHSYEQRQLWQQSMCDFDEGDPEDFSGPSDINTTQQEKESEEEGTLRNVRISNPWAFAKINASALRNKGVRETERTLEGKGQLLTPIRQRGELVGATTQQMRIASQESGSSIVGLPTPKHTQGYFGATGSPQASFPLTPFSFPKNSSGKIGSASKTHKVPQQESGNLGALDMWLQNPADTPPVDTLPTTQSHDDDMQDRNAPVQARARDFVSARTLPIGESSNLVLEMMPITKRMPKASRPMVTGVNKPFISPITDPEQIGFERGPRWKGRSTQTARTSSVANTTIASTPNILNCDDSASIAGSSSTSTISTVDPGLAATMDYETRKQAATQAWRANQRQQAKNQSLAPELDEQILSAARTSPYKNRYNRAIAVLHAASDTAAEIIPKQLPFEPGDPRAYLIRAQERDHQRNLNSSSPPRSKRRKTRHLPLEVTTSEDSATRDLVLSIDTEKLDVTALLALSGYGQGFCDENIYTRVTRGAFEPCPIRQIRDWELTVQELLDTQYEAENAAGTDGSCGVRLNLWTTLQSHRKAFP